VLVVNRGRIVSQGIVTFLHFPWQTDIPDLACGILFLSMTGWDELIQQQGLELKLVRV